MTKTDVVLLTVAISLIAIGLLVIEIVMISSWAK